MGQGAVVMVRTLYRVVRSFPPSVDDFLSNQAKGLPPRGPEVSMPELHSGISMFHTVAGAQGAARRMRSGAGKTSGDQGRPRGVGEAGVASGRRKVAGSLLV